MSVGYYYREWEEGKRADKEKRLEIYVPSVAFSFTSISRSLCLNKRLNSISKNNKVLLSQQINCDNCFTLGELLLDMGNPSLGNVGILSLP